MPLSTDIKAVLLDLDGTLVDTSVAEAAARGAVVGRIATLREGLDAQEIDGVYQSIAVTTWTRVFSGSPPKSWDGRPVVENIIGSVMDRFGVRRDDDPAELTDLFMGVLRQHYRLYPDAGEALKWLRGRYPLAVVSNGPSDEQRHKLRALGIEETMDAVLISEEVGAGKPEPRIFEVALEELSVSAGEAVHVGDSVKSDVGGAKAAGLAAVWVNRYGVCREPQGPVPDAMILSLAELAGLLGEML